MKRASYVLAAICYLIALATAVEGLYKGVIVSTFVITALLIGLGNHFISEGRKL